MGGGSSRRVGGGSSRRVGGGGSRRVGGGGSGRRARWCSKIEKKHAGMN